MIYIDARLPIRFGPLGSRRPNEAVLTTETGDVTAPMARFTLDPAGHPLDCRCCQPRGAIAVALAGLFRDRALSDGQPFCGVLAVVPAAAEAAVREAVTSDAFASGRYRLT